ncbi:TniQ family protein [Kitasatospora sp. NPDC098663]|uniref:TniQ family protein n=1 Tax=Kitasatospora sp. NPDC098663 TaxID=3364096 RepID=UPI0037FBC1D0
MTALLPPSRLRPLPRTVAPLHRESKDSYIERLAMANRLFPDDLHDQLAGPRPFRTDRIPLPAALAQAAGQSLVRLLLALPDLASADFTALLPPACRDRLNPGWSLRPVCALCLAAKRVRHARHWTPPGTTLCLQHGRWTGAHGQQFAVTALPEVLRAQRRHYRLIRGHGWRDVARAMDDALRICGTWWDNRRFTQALDRRRAVLRDPAWAGHGQSLTVAACGYPEVVALAGLFLTPALRALPFTGRTGDYRRFVQEVRDRAAPGYWDDKIASNDPLTLWIEAERHHHTTATGAR